MRLIIKDFSLQAAFERLGDELEDIDPSKWPKDIEKMTNLHDYDELDVEELASKLEGNGTLYGYIETPFGSNANKTQSGVNHIVHKGTKEWGTSYMAVWDNPKSIEMVPGSRSAMKGDAVTVARTATEATGRSTYVIIGKFPKGFSRVQSEIVYKPSLKQELGVYILIW